MKLFRFLQSKNGLSRRKIFDFLRSQPVFLNDVLIDNYSVLLSSGDVLRVGKERYLYEEEWNGEHTHKKESQLLVFHKPVGYIVSNDARQWKTIYDFFPTWWDKEFFYVWRLDKESSGLLLLTNKREKVHDLSHPSKGCLKRYELTIRGSVSALCLSQMCVWVWADESWILWDEKSGDTYDFLKAERACLLKEEAKRTVIELVLSYGKKRHIRRLARALWLHVVALHRTHFGPYSLGDISPGDYLSCDDFTD